MISERTVAVTCGSIFFLGLLGAASGVVLATIVATSAIWCLIVWAVFIRP